VCYKVAFGTKRTNTITTGSGVDDAKEISTISESNPDFSVNSVDG
jgi:hypothetical protein